LSEEPCPLCAGGSRAFLSADGRDYRRCGTCALTFLPPGQHAEPARERARYAEHRNGPEDAGYRAFLDKVLAPLCARLKPGAEGLDYGCGPGPAASVMLRERGFPTTDYDPFFAPDAGALARTYDFVVCTEVLEHLRRPAEDLARLDGLLRPGGILAAMTGVLEDDAAFAGWWYRRDFTHVSFYRPETLAWIARRFGWTLERPARDAALFLKPALSAPGEARPGPR
jgi:SAM-dependent methyltransferase